MKIRDLFKYENNILAKNGVEQTLLKMKELGYSLNVLTASPHSLLDPCLKRIGLWDLFDNVWSVEDFKLCKEDVNLFYAIAKAVGEKPENCVMVDDSVGAIRTAKKAGFQTVGIFDRYNFGQERLKKFSDIYLDENQTLDCLIAMIDNK